MKSIIIITILTLASIFSTVLLLQNVAGNQSPTLDQMLSKQNRDLLSHSRQFFNVESEPIIVAIFSPSFPLSAERLQKFEVSLRAINGVASSYSSASLNQASYNKEAVLSADKNTAIILLLLKPGTQNLKSSKKISSDIRKTVEANLRKNESVSISGLQQIRAASWEIANRDLEIMLPLLVVMTVLITLIFFNSFTALALSLLLASLTTAICLAGHILFNAQLNMLIILVIPVIWAIATLDAFHLYSRSTIKTGLNDPTPVETASRELFTPCLLTTITTAACFLTLTLLDTSPLIKTFGSWGAAGAIIAFVLTFTVGKKLLSLNQTHRPSAQWPGKLCAHIVMLAEKHRILIITFWLVLLVASIMLIPRTQVSTPFPQVFASGETIAAEIDQLKALTGTDLNALDIIIEANDSQGERIANMASATLLTNNYLKTIDETRLVLPIDLIDKDGWQEIIDQWRKEPSLADSATLNHWINHENNSVRLQVFMAETSYERKQEIFDWLEHFDNTMLSHHKITLSGAAYFHNLVEKQGLESLLTSSLLCMLIVTLTMAWITRSARQTLIALSASIIPTLILAALMVLLEIPWNIALLPLPAIALGLMADDTIHIIWFSRRTQPDSTNFLQHNARRAGPALLATTLVLSCAAAILMLSGLLGNQYLGMLIPLILLVAFLCNLSLLPALNSYRKT